MTPPRTRLTGPAVDIAPRLLGAVLVSDLDGETVAVRLTEVEAYEGVKDAASHAYRGRTQRTAVMFGPPGHLYCYFTYGMHWCANVVCGTDGVAAAVLLRAGEVIAGLDAARRRRPAARRDADLARGPARRPRDVQTGPRVGITAAADRPWRFWLPGRPSVSAYKAGGRTRPPTVAAD
ncbi:MAG TPA: DNA-3-methyladenine glycosylase [Jatrophihabitans sp.]|nr:DNA-3-methyladenine glycosylase [Jatrophihabitans sp.]